MALRVPKAEITTELGESMIRQLGAVPEPLEVLWNNPKLATANQEFSAKVAEWDAADPSLKTFAHMAVAAQVGCSWCLDVNYFQALNQNLNLAKASQVPRWRESEVFTQVEREVLEYAEAMTNTPPTVTDERDRSFAASSRGVAFREPQVAAAFGETGPSGPAGAEGTHGSWQGHTGHRRFRSAKFPMPSAMCTRDARGESSSQRATRRRRLRIQIDTNRTRSPRAKEEL